jgi:predicted MFS family arabinose efflux permease
MLCAGFFLVDFDLVVMNPLLLPVSASLGVGLGSVTLVLTGYLLLFGIMQPVHGMVSDRIGRIRVLRIALVGMAVGNVAAATAPSLALLVAGRTLAGAFAAAIIPVTMAYVGDRTAAEHRQRTMATLMASSALGAAAAAVCAGVFTDVLGWRSAVLLVAVGAPVLAALYARLPDEVPAATRARARAAGGRIRKALGRPWLRFVIAFAFVEGAAMVGFFNFFTVALQARGHSVLTAGLATSTYGIAAVGGGTVVRLLDRKVSGAAMFGGGTALLFAGYVVAAVEQNVATILIASVLAGAALTVAQSALQAWVLEASAPQVRGTVAALVACSVFTGAAVGTAAVGGLAGTGEFGTLFAIAAAVTLAVAAVGTGARARFARPARQETKSAQPV